MQGAQSRGNGLPSFFACLTEFALPIGLHPTFHTRPIAMAPRALLSCQCAFYFFVQASVPPPQLARGDTHSAALRAASQLRAQLHQTGLS
jgi:hypothetical protein